MSNFAPTVMVDGRVVTPQGWMWVVGLALAGCEWAVVEASKPDFREQVASWLLTEQRAKALQEIAALEQRIASIKDKMGITNTKEAMQ